MNAAALACTAEPRRATIDGDFELKLAALEEMLSRRGLVVMARLGEEFEPCAEVDGAPVPQAECVIRIIGEAWLKTAGISSAQRRYRAHVEQLAAAIRASGQRNGGPVWITRTAWLLLASYAATGAPPVPREA